ncbi:putative esterase [Litorivivens lipolytica]|uniref:Putative esterase n=1 Tax=Litorivivens lipolytica TaxID=1524264 RepID=A0A7W4W2X3_9GAMM|nr:hypothetical protein [Litorivivens lipolytica]MBB3046465.1 putative esterase [Litorivivens lipolytica]
MRVLLAVTLLPLLVACNGSSSSSSSAPVSPGSSTPPVVDEPLARGLPEGVPEAARGQEPALVVPPAWPFPEGAPRTSGTGRYAHGAFYWTDFIYDAHGAVGANPPLYRVGTPSGGSFEYSEPAMAGNGADIFRVGIGRADGNLMLRVDWQTLIDLAVPIAAFAIDFREGGQDAVPGISNLSAPGIDAVIFLSDSGLLIDNLDGAGPVPLGTVQTDLASRSFVGLLPEGVFSYDRTWQLYLVSGIHNGSGGFRDDNQAFRKLPHQPPVFNVAFRDYEDEPALNNFWFDQTQATALNQGDISQFSLTLDWSRMGETEPEPLVLGYSNRWYVSSLSGRELTDGGQAAGIDRTPNPVNQPQYLDAVQPYGVYVPSSYVASPTSPTLFTWLLHSLTQNHNQYSATVPNFLEAACEQLRQSICATTLGRGGAGGYSGSAELDFWEVWRDVATHFTIDPDRVISSGYSMGAIGTINLMIKYPDVFAGGAVLAGAHADSPLLPCSPGSSGCSEPKGPELMKNLKWNGYYQAHGSFDQLVPFADARATVDAMKDNGYRYVFDHYIAEDHVIWTLKDIGYSAFEEAAKWMVDWLSEVGQRKIDPGNFSYRWEPAAIDEALGIGPKGAWWLSDIAAVAGAEWAEITLDSQGLSEPLIEAVPADPEFLAPSEVTLSPAIREAQSWAFSEPDALGGVLTIKLEQVAALTLDMARAGVAGRADKVILLDSSNAVALTLTGLRNGTQVSSGAVSERVRAGTVTLSLPAGEEQRIEFAP